MRAKASRASGSFTPKKRSAPAGDDRTIGLAMRNHYKRGGGATKIPPSGGSVSVSNKRLKNEFGLAVVQNGGGELRLCGAHAAFLLVRTLRPELKGAGCSEAWFEKQLPGTLDPKDDPTADDIKRVVAIHGVALDPVYNLSPHALIQRGRDVILL